MSYPLTFYRTPWRFVIMEAAQYNRVLILKVMHGVQEVILKAISISDPGIYRLQVVDRNGCIGADTITVTQKQCLSGLFVPTAFTPNNDGLNDNLKAMLFGDILSFDFKIFNRYGAVVFASNNPAKGWDGTIAGLKQDAGVYVWVCKYKLAGKPELLEKGTFVLIR
ncbi:MAG: gliding motility-associated C-terminal domain-containing protein [Chitinophagaceae bacterium]|nr:gliding motility-associated C-terminal domain-containing protein [Chitinophagaceae bacterium]